MGYISFESYKEFGGIINDVATFSSLCINAEAKMNYLTDGRIDAFIKSLTVPESIPDEFIAAETAIINLLQTSNVNRDSSLSSYSNGIETFGYDTSKDDFEGDLLNRVSKVLLEYLWKYPQLTYRGRKRV